MANGNDPQKEFRIGPFSIGDLLALGAVIFMGGANWLQVMNNKEDINQLNSRVSTIELVVPNNYVRRDEYREDLKELKELLSDIRQDILQHQQRRDYESK